MTMKLPPTVGSRTRDDRLGAALRANLARRKAQARARGAPVGDAGAAPGGIGAGASAADQEAGYTTERSETGHGGDAGAGKEHG